MDKSEIEVKKYIRRRRRKNKYTNKILREFYIRKGKEEEIR